LVLIFVEFIRSNILAEPFMVYPFLHFGLRGVIPAEAGIHENTGFRIKSGMTKSMVSKGCVNDS